jgi:hypothetical protein
MVGPRRDSGSARHTATVVLLEQCSCSQNVTTAFFEIRILAYCDTGITVRDNVMVTYGYT